MTQLDSEGKLKSTTLRAKFLRQSKDKHYPTLPKPYGNDFVSEPWIELDSIPAEQAKVYFTNFDKNIKKDENGKIVKRKEDGYDRSNGEPLKKAADSQTVAQRQAAQENVTSLFSGKSPSNAL